MDKPTLVADVRSISQRSSPDEPTNTATSYGRSWNGRETSKFGLEDPAALPLNRTKDVMNTLQTATALSRLLPGVPLILVNLPMTDGVDDKTSTAADPAVSTASRHKDEQLAIVRADLAAAFPQNVPAAAEALLSELGVIDRQDRSYYATQDHDQDANTAYAYRQHRRDDILAEIIELKRRSNID